MQKKETVINNQKGIASMVIVILIMTLLSLIVVSMTRTANREQKQALDRQLNSQAFYAAESGINDARDYYINNASDPTNPASEEKDDCSGVDGAGSGEQFPGYSSTVGEDVNSYSCVLYDANPETLDFSTVSTNNSVVIPLKDKDGDNIQSLTFTWKRPIPENQENDANDIDYDFSSCNGSNPPKFPTYIDDSCDAGVLRIELIDSNAITRDELIARNFLAFVSPSSGAVATKPYGNALGTVNQGASWRGGCTSGIEGKCSITISGINKQRLILHLKSVYKENAVSISGAKSGGDAIEFDGAQMMIDATGRASDVLKRVRVRSPLSEYSTSQYAEAALQTGGSSICKLLEIVPPGPGFPASQDHCD